MLSSGLSLVEALKSTIVTFVKSPMLMDWDIVLVELSYDCVVCHNSAGENRGVSNIKLIALLFEELTSVHCFLSTVLTQGHICPPSEAVLLVPCGLSVAHEDHLEDLVRRILLQHF